MSTRVSRRRESPRLGRSSFVFIFAAVLTSAALGCSAAPDRRTRPGELELSVVGVTEHGARYRVQGSFSVYGLDNGLHAHVSSDENPAGAVVRRPLPPGLYSVTLNPDFQLAPLTNGSDTPSSPLATLHAEAPGASAPKLVIVESDRRAAVQLQSFTPGLRSESPLASAK
jgi:hypothetical protein